MEFKTLWRALVSHKPDEPLLASVLFPGSLPPRPEELGALATGRFRVERLPDDPAVHWGLGLEHPAWGKADVLCVRQPTLPPTDLVEHAWHLTTGEKQAIGEAGALVLVRLHEPTPRAFVDRKHLLRFARAVMDDHGVAVADHQSWLFWSRPSLDEELAHDAPLDVSDLYTLHAVSTHTDGRVDWLHTHGLGEMGFFDFDIVRPSRAILGRASVLLRAIAFGILEGRFVPTMDSCTLADPGGTVSFVEANDFARRAPRDVLELWTADAEHRTRRSVLCEPRTGLLARVSKKVEPSRFLSQAQPDRLLIEFSDRSTRMIAERARATYGVFRSLVDEFRDLSLPAIVKLGYPTDDGNGREHLWFSVHDLRDSSIDATLDNAPFEVSALRQGDRRLHAVQTLTEWAIVTPLGMITSCDLSVARQLRERRDEVRRQMPDFLSRISGG